MDDTLKKEIQERLGQLPRVVRNAITSSDVEKKLRNLEAVYKLHLDQWEKLEKEVMLTLLGFDDPKDLEENIKKEVAVSDGVAAALTAEISKTIRQRHARAS